MKKLLYWAIWLIGITACVNPKGKEVLAEAERLMRTSPDSALLVLEQAKKEATTYSRRNRMHYLLLQAEAMNKAYLPLDTLTSMHEVLDYYLSHGNRDERMRACYLMGSVWRDRGNSPLALQYFRDAIGEADTTATDCDYTQVSRIYAQIARLFDKQRYPQMELEQWKQAMRYALLAKDTLMYIQCQEYIGDAYFLLGKEDSVLYFTQQAYEAYLKYGRKDWAAATQIVIADYYLKHDSLANAKQALDEYRNGSGFFEGDGNVSSGYEIFYYYIGEYYEKMARLDSAVFYYRKLLNYPADIMNAESGYKGLMSVYTRMHEVDSVAKYAHLFANANDTANLRNSANEISRTQALYDYSESQRIAVEKSEENQRLWAVLCMGFIVLTLGGVWIYGYYRKQKANQMLANRKYTDLMMQYHQATEELQSIRSNKQQFQQQKEEEIEKLRQMLDAYQTNTHADQWELEQSLLQHDIVKRMHQHAYKLVVPSDAEWNDLQGVVEKSLPEFYAKLSANEAQLTDQEWKVCLLVKLNFIPSELTVLLNLSKQRVTNIRTHLNQKLFGESGSRTFDSNLHKL
ncbi:putative lipoprotein [Bacteroides sp. CAG:702]|nr:putative lipoprotein [Bacteroides sp. CAG:702]